MPEHKKLRFRSHSDCAVTESEVWVQVLVARMSTPGPDFENAVAVADLAVRELRKRVGDEP